MILGPNELRRRERNLENFSNERKNEHMNEKTKKQAKDEKREK